MTTPVFSLHHTQGPLVDTPITPEWILEGAPKARARLIEESSDGMACSLVWECTAGKFEWHYDIDETILVLEGGMTLRQGDEPERKVSAGDVIFFPKGSRAIWTIESHVRKFALCHAVLPRPIKGAARPADVFFGKSAPTLVPA